MCEYIGIRAGEELGCDEEFVHKAAVAGMLHDVGKIQISPYIYGRRQGAMKIEEMRYVRLHAKLGRRYLSVRATIRI